MRYLYPADGTAKTGQSLIASSIFQDLPEAPKVVEEEMEVEPTPVAEAETKEGAEVKEGETEEKDKKAKKTVVQPPKYTAPIDPITGDLMPECTVYLRLLLILANLDAARVQQVSRRILARKARWIQLMPGRRIRGRDGGDRPAGKQEDDGSGGCESLLLPCQSIRAARPTRRASVVSAHATSCRTASRARADYSLLLAARQTAALRKDETTEVTVINLLLRSYLSHNQYDQADRLIAKTNFQGQVNQAQSVRWLFYAGRLRAIQLNYSKAKDYFQTAIRRAPKDEVAPGFVQAVSCL